MTVDLNGGWLKSEVISEIKLKVLELFIKTQTD